ncbi:MAG TPA: hypothetical protein VGA37_01895 [Gemmatimonadales bacterium]
MSSDESPEFQALAELETVVGNLSDAMATWRRRALKAESQRAAVAGSHDAVAARERVLELESANAELMDRLDVAREKVEHLVARLKFLEEQAAAEEQAG